MNRLICHIVLGISLISICIPTDGSIIENDVSDWPINISSNEMISWSSEGIRVFNAQKEFKISQGNMHLVADNAVCWFQEVQPADLAEATMEVYCEGNVTLVQPGDEKAKDKHVKKYEQLYLLLTTTMGVAVDATAEPVKVLEGEEATETYLRAKMVRNTQYGMEFTSNDPLTMGPAITVPAKEEMVDVFADNIESWTEGDQQIVVATGNVRIKRAQETLTADNVILWFDRKEAEEDMPVKQTFKEVYAEGNVTLRRENDYMIADKVFENKKEGKGIYMNNRFKATLPNLDTPVYFSSDEIKKDSEGEFTATNGIISTCGFGHPHYHFKGNKIRLIKNKDSFKVSSTGNTIYGSRIPFLYQPYLAWNTNQRLFPVKKFEVGTSSRFGPTIQTDWDLYAFGIGKQMTEWSDLTLNLDYMYDRGVGTGTEFNYNRPKTSGTVTGYYISDQGNDDRLGREKVPIDNDNRGRFLWRNRRLLPYDVRADIEVAYLSDDMFLREYFREDFKLDKDQESVLYLRRLKDNTGLTLEAERHLNNIDTLVESGREGSSVESLPAVQYNVIGKPLLKGKLNLESQTQLAYFDRIRKDPDKGYSSASTARFDTGGTVNMPLHPLSLNFNPFIGGRFTAYDNGVDVATKETENSARYRFIGSLGFDLTTTLSKVYRMKNDLFQIDHLRHIMTPELRLVTNPFVTEDSEELVQIDEVDALDDSHVLMMGIRNRLQTKRGRPGNVSTVDFINFDFEMYLFPGKAAFDTEGISGMRVRSNDFIQWAFTAQLTDRLTLESERNEFNLAKIRSDIVNSGLRYQHSPKWSYFAGYRFIKSVSSSVMLNTDYRLTEKWAVSFYEHFDFNASEDLTGDALDRGSQNLKTQFVLSRFFHEFRGDFTIELDEIRNDKVARFDLVPVIFTKQKQRRKRLWF